jgi:hypothetical protein
MTLPMILIGRVKTNDIIITGDTSVSREHCSFEFDPEGVLRVRDLGSSNGTFLNGEVLGDEAEVVELGHRVQVGGTIIHYLEKALLPQDQFPLSLKETPKEDGPLIPVEGEDQRTQFIDGVCTCGRCLALLPAHDLKPGEKIGCPHCRAVWKVPWGPDGPPAGDGPPAAPRPEGMDAPSDQEDLRPIPQPRLLP